MITPTCDRWNYNWAMGSVVTDGMLSEDGAIWTCVHLCDVSGTMQVRMPETVALTLSSHKVRQDFIQAATDEYPIFPTLMSVKIARRQHAIPRSTLMLVARANPPKATLAPAHS